jgi:protein pelota
MLSTDEMRAWYGPKHVCLAADRGAIGTLLISDELFRYVSATVLTSSMIHFWSSSSNPLERKRFVSLVEAVQKKGGDVQIFSSMHESGQRE